MSLELKTLQIKQTK